MSNNFHILFLKFQIKSLKKERRKMESYIFSELSEELAKLDSVEDVMPCLFREIDVKIEKRERLLKIKKSL